MVAENSKKLRGAASEIGDVHDSLERVEQVESRVERDLRSLLTALSSKNETDADRQQPLQQQQGRLASLFGLKQQQQQQEVPTNPSVAVVLSEHLANMRRDLASLVTTINATREELAEAREAVGSTEKALEEARYAERRAKVAERLRDGKATVDYETGEVSTLLSHSERRRIGTVLGAANLSKLEARLLEDSLGLRREGSSKHDARRFDRERQRADPAMLHLDARFLQDMVVLSLSTALGGLLAAALGAPYTLGNMLGGVVVGPSCLDLVRNLEQTETLAQFGSIFLLFSHGLMYSRIYGGSSSKRRRAKTEKDTAAGGGDPPSDSEEETMVAEDSLPVVDSSATSSVPEAPIDGENGDSAHVSAVEMDGRALSSGFALVFGMGLAFACASRFVGVASGLAEAVLYSAAFSLSSSNTVLSTLREARLDDSVFGRTVVELLSVQDLVLAPLFALPTAVSDLAYGSKHLASRPLEIAWIVATYTVLIITIVLAARRILPRALAALGGADDERESKSSTWQAASKDGRRRVRRTSVSRSGASRQTAKNASLGLCVIGYALAMALLADRLKLSHEAGALFAGLVLVGTPHVDKAKRAVEPLTSLFGGMYIASLGLVASPKYLSDHAFPLLVRVSSVLLLKVLVVAPLVYGLGFSRIAALAAGVVFGQVSEVSLFVAARAHRLNLVQRATYLDVLSSTVVLLAVAPLSVHVVRRIDRSHFQSLEIREKKDDYKVAGPASGFVVPRWCPSCAKWLFKIPFNCATSLFFSAKRRFIKKR